jgi:polysaccharide pyruvyl transferase WcaK-like protein
MSLKRFSFRGYYGFQNAGDDALASVAVWGARKYWHADSLCLFATSLPGLPPGIEARAGLKRGIFAVMPSALRSADRRRKEARILQETEFLVFGGGSILLQAAALEYWLDCVRRLKKRGGAAAAIGVSVGPFESSRAEKLYQEMVHELDFICVRDHSSYEFLSSWRTTTPAVEAFDLAALLPQAFGLPQNQAGHPAGGGAEGMRPGGERKILGISLCNYPQDGLNQAREDSLVDALLRWDAGKRISLRLFDFNDSKVYGDAPLSQRLAARLGGKYQIEHTRYNPDPSKLYRGIVECHVLIGVRLHSAVFAYRAECPLLLIQYHKKCTGFLDAIGAPEWSYLPPNGGTSAEVIQNLEAAFDSRATPRLAVEEAVRQSGLNFSTAPARWLA